MHCTVFICICFQKEEHHRGRPCQQCVLPLADCHRPACLLQLVSAGLQVGEGREHMRAARPRDRALSLRGPASGPLTATIQLHVPQFYHPQGGSRRHHQGALKHWWEQAGAVSFIASCKTDAGCSLWASRKSAGEGCWSVVCPLMRQVRVGKAFLSKV